MVETATITYQERGKALGSHMRCPCGSTTFLTAARTDPRSSVAWSPPRKSWSRVLLGCPVCNRVLTADGVVLEGVKLA